MSLIWLPATRRAAIVSAYAANTADWRALREVCDAWLNTDVYGPMAFNYGLAYLASGNQAHGKKAVALVQPIVDFGMPALFHAVPGASWIEQTSEQGYNVRSVLPYVSVIYNWCGDLLTPAQQTRWAAQLNAWANWVWPETNPARKGAYGVDNPADNFFHGFLSTWYVGLAGVGDPRHASVAMNRWTQAKQYCAATGRGGWFSEGSFYGSETRSRIFLLLAAGSSVGIIDLFRLLWVDETILSLIHETLPGRTRVAVCGEQTGDDPTGTIVESQRTAMRVAANYCQGDTAGYARFWLESLATEKLNRWDYWLPLVFPANTPPVKDYTRTLPLGYLSPGGGRCVVRSSWHEDAVVLTTQAGPMEASHQDRANGGFAIYAGNGLSKTPSTLAATTHYTAGSGHTLDTRLASSGNAITVGGLEQPELDPDLDAVLLRLGLKKGEVLFFEDTEDYAYIVTSCAGSYAYRQWPAAVQPLAEWIRVFFFVKTSDYPYVVIYDRATKNPPASGSQPTACAWLCNLLKQPPLVARVVDQGRAMDVVGLIPAGHPDQEPVKLGNNGAVSSYRWREEGSATAAVDSFLNVLVVGTANSTPILSAEILNVTRAAAEAALEINGPVGIDTDDAVLIAPHTLPLTFSTRAERLFVTGLVAGKTYSLAPGELAAVASPQGVCAFEGLADPGSVTLSEGTPPPAPQLATLTVEPARIVSGALTQVTATLSSPTPRAVFLNVSVVGEPTPVMQIPIAAGENSGGAPFLSRAGQTGVLLLSAAFGGVTRTASLAVVAPSPPSVVVSGKVTGAGLDQLVTGGKYRLTPEGSTTSWQIELTRVN